MASWPAPAGMAAPYQAASAYTPVQVRQTFGQATSAMAQYPPVHSYGTSSYPSLHSPAAPTNLSVPDPAATPAQESQEAPKQKKIEWPDSVRRYVQRSFLPANMDHSVSRAEMEAKLKETISQANDQGVMYSIDWDAMKLPQEMIKDERARNLALPQTMALMQQVHSQDHPAATATPGNAYHPPRPMTYAAVVTSNPKKRKSSDFPDQKDQNAAPPWRTGGRLEDRVTFSNDRRGNANNSNNEAAKSKFQQKMEKRQKKFDGGYKSSYRSPSPPPNNGPVVGTCQELLKRYLRLTSAPNPQNVRPESVLRQTLVYLKKKWSQQENYPYICDQFKSMRQDLTVQRIQNEFTVEVYECHARIALEKGDLGEYNQCQTRLKALYEQGIKGNPNEFKAYRILYFIHTANRSALNDIMATLTPAEKKDEGIKHALDVRSALALGNYHRFFQLYSSTPNMGSWLMDMFVLRERLKAMCFICKSYGPSKVTLRFVTDELFFETDADAAQFILDYGGKDLLVENDEGQLVFKASQGLPSFTEHKDIAFSRIDIKGQI